MIAVEERRPTARRRAEALAVHSGWSHVNRRFLAFAQRDAILRDRTAFEEGMGSHPLRRFGSVQPWPLFIATSRRRELEAMAVGLDQLVKSVPTRFFDNDPARILRYYALPPRGVDDDVPYFRLDPSEALLALLLDDPNGIAPAIARGDFMDTTSGLKCLEYNVGSGMGGLFVELLCEQYLRSPPISRFLRQEGITPLPMETSRLLFRHVVEDTIRRGFWEGGDLNLAMLVYPHTPERAALFTVTDYDKSYIRALKDVGGPRTGRVFLCACSDLTPQGDRLAIDGAPIHAVVEQHDGRADPRLLFRFFKARRLNLFSGPISSLLSDKRHLAVLSEHETSADLSSAERELVAKHVPWTRRLIPGRTTFRRRPITIPKDIAERRRDFVIKKASSQGGLHVRRGRDLSPDDWQRALARALVEQDWVVQEHLESRPYHFQGGPRGSAVHDVIWGLFVFGRWFGGVFLRVLPADVGGIVNVQQGADMGTVLEVGDRKRSLPLAE